MQPAYSFRATHRNIFFQKLWTEHVHSTVLLSHEAKHWSGWTKTIKLKSEELKVSNVVSLAKLRKTADEKRMKNNENYKEKQCWIWEMNVIITRGKERKREKAREVQLCERRRVQEIGKRRSRKSILAKVTHSFA